jgi:hypothetical protein
VSVAIDDDSDKENNASASPSISQYIRLNPRLNQNLKKRAQTEMQISSSDSDDVLTSAENRHPRKRRKIAKKTVVTATNPLPMPTTATIPGTS